MGNLSLEYILESIESLKQQQLNLIDSTNSWIK